MLSVEGIEDRGLTEWLINPGVPMQVAFTNDKQPLLVFGNGQEGYVFVPRSEQNLPSATWLENNAEPTQFETLHQTFIEFAQSAHGIRIKPIKPYVSQVSYVREVAMAPEFVGENATGYVGGTLPDGWCEVPYVPGLEFRMGNTSVSFETGADQQIRIKYETDRMPPVTVPQVLLNSTVYSIGRDTKNDFAIANDVGKTIAREGQMSFVFSGPRLFCYTGNNVKNKTIARIPQASRH